MIRPSGSGGATAPNYQLANEIHRQIIRTFKRRKMYSSFRYYIWGVDLADMQSLSKYDKEIRYLLCEIDFFSKYAWVVSLKGKRGISIVNAYKKIIWRGRKPSKIWVDQRDEFYNYLFNILLKYSKIEMYSTYNEGKSVAAERFAGTLKNKIFKHMAAISKTVYVDLLVDIVKNTIT